MKKNRKEAADGFSYRMLDRLQSDCDYYLLYGGRCAKHLYFMEESLQIAGMLKVYDRITIKPRWLSRRDIFNYAQKMGVPVKNRRIKELRDFAMRAWQRVSL